jgi:DNA polymerase-3 subunit gamma/tau
MSYLVLARKYRPQTFAEVVGQEHVTRTLANASRQARVHHALPLLRPARGRQDHARPGSSGRALNCEKGPTGRAVRRCQPCTTIAAGNAVDYIEWTAPSNRGIDAIRDLDRGGEVPAGGACARRSTSSTRSTC